VTRRTWIALLWAVFAVSGLGRLSGTWSVEISLLPTPALRSSALALGYTAPRWSVASASEFSSPWDWVWQEFNFHAAFPGAGLTGDVLFGPALPDFLYAQFIASTRLAGAEFGLYAALIGPALGGPHGGAVLRVSRPSGSGAVNIVIGFGASLPEDGLTIYHVSGLSKTYATDPRPGGFQFTEVGVSLSGLSLCCGIRHDLAFVFTKAGFQYVKFIARDLPGFCCGISFDASVTFSGDAKEVSISPRSVGITGCLALYGDVRFADNVWDGFAIYGWRLRCEWGDCAYIESLTAFDVTKVEEILDDETIFEGEEFEYLKLGLCGPGCCGRNYTLDVAVYFVPSGAFLGINRVTVEMTVPLGAGFTLKAEFATPNTLALGWSFAF